MKEIKDCFDKLFLIIAQLQEIEKQNIKRFKDYNTAFLDLYERVAKLEQKDMDIQSRGDGSV